MPNRSKQIPASHTDILDSKCFPHVATVRPDGQLSNHPVCLIWDGECIRFSITKSRKKYRNLVADPRIALSIPDVNNIWRYLEIRGTVTLEDDKDRSFINQIARKYMDQDEYPFDPPGEERVTVTVHHEQVSAGQVHADENDGQVPEAYSS
jgi:PPOX class probable F420-dependent enzyme